MTPFSLDFDWHYPISLKSNREGMIDSTTYFLAYFYPRVAVYDDYNGCGPDGLYGCTGVL